MRAAKAMAGRAAPTPVTGAGAVAATTPWPLHDALASRALEHAAARGLEPHTLMARAGDAVARLALALAPHAQRVWIIAGPGNNGGDGLEAAACLQRAGKQVSVSLQADTPLPSDAAASLARACAAGATIQATLAPPSLGSSDLAIDALFGLGLKRAPQAWALQAITALNRSLVPVLAIDLPSGLHADHGTVFASAAAVHARWTLGVLTLKPGLFTAEGRDHAGAIWFDGLGVSDDGASATACLSSDTNALWPSRRHAEHKGSFGDVWAVGGAPGMAGAAVLCARAASTAGAGRVHLVVLDSGLAALDSARPELMLRNAASLHARSTALEDGTVVCGCGGGDAVRSWLPLLMARAGRLLLDADALNAVAADASLLRQWTLRAARGRPGILTPHPLEAARLLGCGTAAVQSDRLGAARELAALCHAVVVLKGSGTVIAAPGEKPWINASGNAALASAGTGDVLAGWIAGLWSQGLATIDAARLGAHSHGAAADDWQAGQRHPGALPASALIDELRRLRAA